MKSDKKTSSNQGFINIHKLVIYARQLKFDFDRVDKHGKMPTTRFW